jgi:hypothetical protein
MTNSPRPCEFLCARDERSFDDLAGCSLVRSSGCCFGRAGGGKTTDRCFVVPGVAKMARPSDQQNKTSQQTGKQC